MIDSVPASAPSVPPLTGASISRILPAWRSCSSAASRRTASGDEVDATTMSKCAFPSASGDLARASSSCETSGSSEMRMSLVQLLELQLVTLEPLEPDEIGFTVLADCGPRQITDRIAVGLSARHTAAAQSLRIGAGSTSRRFEADGALEWAVSLLDVRDSSS